LGCLGQIIEQADFGVAWKVRGGVLPVLHFTTRPVSVVKEWGRGGETATGRSSRPGEAHSREEKKKGDLGEESIFKSSIIVLSLFSQGTKCCEVAAVQGCKS